MNAKWGAIKTILGLAAISLNRAPSYNFLCGRRDAQRRIAFQMQIYGDKVKYIVDNADPTKKVYFGTQTFLCLVINCVFYINCI